VSEFLARQVRDAPRGQPPGAGGAAVRKHRWRPVV